MIIYFDKKDLDKVVEALKLSDDEKSLIKEEDGECRFNFDEYFAPEIEESKNSGLYKDAYNRACHELQFELLSDYHREIITKVTFSDNERELLLATEDDYKKQIDNLSDLDVDVQQVVVFFDEMKKGHYPISRDGEDKVIDLLKEKLSADFNGDKIIQKDVIDKANKELSEGYQNTTYSALNIGIDKQHSLIFDCIKTVYNEEHNKEVEEIER